jgi:hypothetical protein
MARSTSAHRGEEVNVFQARQLPDQEPKGILIHALQNLQLPALHVDLSQFSADRSWEQALGYAGRKRVEAEFSWLKTAQSYLELL